MTSKMDKFDIKILDTTTDRFKYIRPVTSLDTFQGMTKDFHDEGLFSTAIFGKVGTPDRDLRFSFINIRVEIFHPKIFSYLCNIKQLYKGIMAGTVYAKWDNEQKDFIKSTNIDGDTGFYFFMQHWEKIDFVKNDSFHRNEAIDNIKKYKKIALTSRVMVIPAGLRDIEIGDNEEVTKHEINDFYTRLLSVSNALPTTGDLNTKLNDRARISLQKTFVELYEYLSTLTGALKKSFMRRKWGTRKIKYGTRNVITTVDTVPRFIGDPAAMKFNDCTMGLYQIIAATAPLLINKLLTGYLTNVVSSIDGKLNLIDPKTLIRNEYPVKSRSIDRWVTPTGIAKSIDAFSDIHIRNKAIVVEGKYLGLVYRDDKHFRLLNDINDLADHPELNRENIHPVTYGELFYIHGYKWFNTIPGTFTRYPINGYRSTFPCYARVLTTTKYIELTELDSEFKPLESIKAYHYPRVNLDDWYDAMAPHPARLPGLGADHDGDACNWNPCLSIEGKKAISDFIDEPKSYLNSSGQLLNNPFSETLERVLWSLTGDVND